MGHAPDIGVALAEKSSDVPVGVQEVAAPVEAPVDKTDGQLPEKPSRPMPRAGKEAGALLQSLQILLEDSGVEAGLAAADSRCGGVMATWQPPWIEAGIDNMDFSDLGRFPPETVMGWAQSFEGLLRRIRQQDCEAAHELAEPDPRNLLDWDENIPVVLLPDRASPWQKEVVGLLLELAGLRAVAASRWQAEARVVPYAVRILILDGLVSEVFGPFPEAAQEELRNPQGPAAYPRTSFPSPNSVETTSTDALRNNALKALLSAGPAASLFAQADAPRPEETRTTQDLHPESVPYTSSSGLGASLEVPCGFGATQIGGSSSSSSGTGPHKGAKSSWPSTIVFIFLDTLERVTATQGEAAAIILAVKQLLAHPALQEVLAELDELCGGLLRDWQPPWVEEEGLQQVSPQILKEYPEATVHDWAMNLDGFVSFLANLASAARHSSPEDQQVVAGSSHVVEEVDSESSGTVHPPASQLQEEETVASPQPASTPVASGAAPEERSGRPAVVLVLPETATDWQLEVLSSCAQMCGGHMLAERAWRNDFGGAESVPFQVEAMRLWPSAEAQGKVEEPRMA